MDTIEEGSMELSRAIRFLERYGYISNTEDTTDNETADELSDSVKDAIVKFQTNYGLEETGLLDEATIEGMKKPRCTVKDVERSKDRLLNYKLDSKWEKNKLTWKITKYPSRNVSENECRKTIFQALTMWQNQADLEFSETENYESGKPE